MIVQMARIRLLGPLDRLEEVLATVQDFGEVQLDRAAVRPGLEKVPAAITRRDRPRALRRVLAAVDEALAVLADSGTPLFGGTETAPGSATSLAPRLVAQWARLARATRRRANRLQRGLADLRDERALLEKYRHFFSAYEELIEAAALWNHAVAYHVVLRPGEGDALERLRASLGEVLEERFALWSRELPGGEIAGLLLVSSTDAERIESLLAAAGVQEIALPASLAGRPASQALPAMRARLEEVGTLIGRHERELRAIAAESGPELTRARAALRDRLALADAAAGAASTGRAFVVDGWIPRAALSRLRDALSGLQAPIAIEELAREEWHARDAPVVLRNPRILRPFEAVLKLLPLPRYGTIDPTPFVAVFFPMLFGLILGDVGYGAVLALLAAVLHVKSRPDSRLRTVAEIAGPCAAFTILFGFAYGELFGDLGRHLFGLHALLLDREEALLPFLVLAVAIGLVHVLLGLLLGALSRLHEGARHALGPGITLIMVVLIVVALLAAVDVLPAAFFTPAAIALLVAFPLLVAAEGVVALIELLSALGHILSYARVMALGTASVMLAVAANRLAGAAGTIAVGVLFGLLFHLVNFALGLFSPTIHALRLHYVEFFGTFYSPGGVPYRPFRHWRPDAGPAGGDR